jgi:1-acyl-sn-glycerol-3-phosphate acyltransferase
VERLIVLAETRETEATALASLRARIEEVAGELLETPPDDIVLAPPHTVLKTSSGKLRRAACRDQYERGEIGARHGFVGWQMARLARRLRDIGRRAQEGLYAAWWWTVLALCAATAWILVLLIPRRRWRWSVVRAAARSMLWLSRTPIRVEGIENLPEAGAILAVNHSSYFDGLALAAAIPGEPCFVAKRELATQLGVGAFLRRLGTLFVERFDLEAGVEDARVMLEAAQAGSRIVSFPEGTLRRMPGLLPFRLGSFRVAAQAKLPVVPIALRGTRSILRGNQWFPRRRSIEVQIGKPIVPRGSDWSAAVHLRDRSRVEMLWMCGEPDLQEERIAP